MLRQSLDSFIRNLQESKSISDCEPVPVEEITDKQDFLFVSYSHRDYKKVYEDLAVMDQAGVKFWYDEGLSVGQNWDEEVKSILLHPRCVGVVFFISEQLFLSKSVNQEINFVCGKDMLCRKPYFSINLTEQAPSRITRAVMRMEDSVLDEAGLDSERIAALSSAFGDRQTYLSFSAKNHRQQLISQIKNQFPSVIEKASANEDYNNYRYLVRKDTGEIIPLNHSVFRIGRDQKWADHVISNSAIGRQHASIFCSEGNAWLLDHNSLNGTCLNGNEIRQSKPVILNDGDEICMSDRIMLTFYVEYQKDEMKETPMREIRLILQGDTRAGKTKPLAALSHSKES